jgi:hypothetical protein
MTLTMTMMFRFNSMRMKDAPSGAGRPGRAISGIALH